MIQIPFIGKPCIETALGMMSGDTSGSKMRVVVVPLPAQGHLNQLLHFSRVIAQRGATVSFVATSTHIHQVRSRVEGWEFHKFDIHFEELPMPHLSGEELDAQSCHTFPIHLIPLFEAMEDQLGSHVDQLLRAICSENNNRVVIVYDSTMGWIQTAATKYSIPAYIFRPISAYYKIWSKRVSNETGGSSPFNISLKRCYPERLIKYLRRQRSLLGPAKGYIINTFSALESEFIRQGREELAYGGKPVWSVGSLLPRAFFNDERRLRLQVDTECMRWLDRQAPASVLYVSFGSISSLSVTQIRELADGLERSGQHFMWVLRISDGAHSSTEAQFDSACKFLEQGYGRRLEGRGLIVRNWAPQLDILFHKSTGGFLTHCGWNSTVESISAGVGMLTWPLHCDQFANSALITRELKAGVEVKEWENAEENEMVSAEEVEKAVKRLMTSEEGLQVRKRAQELRGSARKAVCDGGSSWKDMDSLLHHFSQSFSD
ncbi:hypothetical protein SUGI_0857040 [Cryptomeria japonica]|uniref:zeatin O-glucosyltransferase n=1 Tax=Cryptomeria japonica TaxID=3369 RepID=UPI0024146B33|nr:zeatin O-glucosyltransferase [Cryptomeria japonica]GLJ41404.1 hypothetical protein SUGI_0857040 [Cryptomeria japonica]